MSAPTRRSAKQVAAQLLAIIERDKDRLGLIQEYVDGIHADPYMPSNATSEYKLLAARSVTNICPFLTTSVAQSLYVDGFRRGVDAEGGDASEALLTTPEWRHWQRSRLDARQAAVYRGALNFGHAFTLTEKAPLGVVTKGLSPLRTSALFADPANDETPYAALTVIEWSRAGEKRKRGVARMWDATNEYQVLFDALGDGDNITVTKVGKHGARECPVTRFAAQVDLEGNTIGVIEPMITLQDRINQTVFDLLVAQTYTSHQVRYATGMAPPVEYEPIKQDGEVIGSKPKIDPETGQPVVKTINYNASRFLMAADENVRFGTLEGGPLDGYLGAIELAFRQFSALSQTPPHYMLGEIANLSAEALNAAETNLQRKIQEFRTIFGEAWERVFRLAAEMAGDDSLATDWSGEVIWRDMESKSLSQSADALGKLAQNLGIPVQGLWTRVPGVTQTELKSWQDLADEEPVTSLAAAVRRGREGGQQSQAAPTTVA